MTIDPQTVFVGVVLTAFMASVVDLGLGFIMRAQRESTDE